MDPIADMINSINNAYAVKKKQIAIYPYSDLKYAILELFKKEGIVSEIDKKGRLAARKILVDLKYDAEGKAPISKIRKISKQGQRIYSAYNELRPVRSGHGMSIISTSKGLMTNKEARRTKIGGEIICEIY